jgi:GR25 family glycosyltransferase involved in LPS biosynthesis
MEVDIREINTYVISLHDVVERRKKILEMLRMMGIKQWHFFNAVDVRNKFPYWIGCGLSHYMTLDQANYPCIVLEDDVAPSEWGQVTIDIPDDGITYLGVSSWGLKNGQSEHMGVVFEENNDNTCVVKYMTSAHAIYYPNKTLAKQFYDGILRHMFETGRPFDEHYALMQLKNKTYALKRPLYYQNCEKNSFYTNFKIG